MTQYFAYGSNIHLPFLRAYLAAHGLNPRGMTSPRRGLLRDYRIRTNYRSSSHGAGAANIDAAKGHTVEGIVLGISPTIQQMLRSKEGWPARYTESRVNVEIAETKKMVKAMTYMVTPEFQLSLNLPVASPYRQLILEGAAMWQFSPQYQRQLRRVLRPMERSQLGV